MSLRPPTFEHLDDPSPPVFDDEAWRRVEGRAREITRRRRFALATTATASAIALVIVVIAWSVAGRDQGGGIATVGSSTSAAGGSSTTVDPSVWVTVALHVDQRSVGQGQRVTGTVVFDNRLTERVALPAGSPTPWQVVVGKGTSVPIVGWLDTSIASHMLDLGPGTTTVPFSAITQEQIGSCPGTGLTGCPPLLPAGPARVWFVTEVPVAHLAVPDPVAISIEGRGERPPQPLPCPVPSPEPSEATGSYCGPQPTPGNGKGPNGECTGHEIDAPCGTGVVPGRYYAYTLPGRCDGRIVFDGRHWISELPPPSPVPVMNVWMRLDANGGLAFISPAGSVAFRPDTGQTVTLCAHS